MGPFLEEYGWPKMDQKEGQNQDFLKYSLEQTLLDIFEN